MKSKHKLKNDYQDNSLSSREKVRQEIGRLRKEIAYHNYLYYAKNEPEISDEAYDKLFRRLQSLENKFPEFAAPDSPTKRIGAAPVTELKKITHTTPLLSLNAVLKETEVKDFLSYIQKNTAAEKVDFVLEPKIDGFSTEVVYRNGQFSYGSTRGDGITGEDISHNLKMIQTLPMTLSQHDSIPGFLAVRGEVYLSKADFLMLNKQRIENGEEPLANPRNAAAGLMRQLDPQKVADKGLDIIFYDILTASNLSLMTHWQELKSLKDWGLKTDTHNKLCSSYEEILAYYAELNGQREELSYETDGTVIKVNQLAIREVLGTRERSPRWALAWKFTPKKEITTLLDIIVQVGRTGVLTPVALLEPVNVGGVTVSRATLHNAAEIQKKDIRPGDKVRIIRAGDVIPEVAESLTAKAVHAAVKGKIPRHKPFKMPEHCPVCQTAVTREGAYYYCPAGLYCNAQLVEHIIHYASKEALNIQGLGDKLSKQLVARQWVKRLPDLYRLSPDDFLKLPAFKEKRAHKLYDAIQASKQTSLERFLYALGIRRAGQHVARLLAREFGNLDAILAARYENFLHIRAIGDEIARSLDTFLNKPENQKTIKELLDLGVSPQSSQREHAGKQTLNGKSVVFTGRLTAYTRQEASEKVIMLGGQVTEKPGPHTDLVVAGKDTGSKWSEAKKRNLKIISEEEFMKLIGKTK